MNKLERGSKIVRLLMASALLIQTIVSPVLYASDFTTPVDASPQVSGMTADQAASLEAAQGMTNHAVGVDLGSPFENPEWTPWNSPLSLSTSANTTQEISTVQGRVFHVSKTGTNASAGSETSPWASVQFAVSKLQAGDTLYIHEGIYSETAGFAVSGRSDAYISVVGVGNVVFDGEGRSTYDPAFDTRGSDYLRFHNISARNMRAVVEITPGSDYIQIDGIRSDKNRFAVRMNTATNVTVRNAVVRDSKNGFRAQTSRNLIFENIEVSGSKDIYEGMNENYLNGDGFIFEADVSNVTVRNVVSYDHWDGGIDCKASNVVIENFISYGNKNNFKMWGQNIIIRNSLGFNAKRQMRSNGTSVEGNGLTVEIGASITLDNVTLAFNEDKEIAIYDNATLRIRNSIVAHQFATGSQLMTNVGVLISDNVLWYELGASKEASFLSPSDHWADPQFVDPAVFNFRLKATSPAIDKGTSGAQAGSLDLASMSRVVGESVDLGAYEFQTDLPAPGSDPAPAPDPVPGTNPGPVPVPDPVLPPVPEVPAEFTGIKDGQTVSGRILFQPNLSLLTGVEQVNYFIDGALKLKQSQAPFTMGGAQGYDTARLKNGIYEFKAEYTLADGVHAFIARIKIENGFQPVPAPVIPPASQPPVSIPPPVPAPEPQLLPQPLPSPQVGLMGVTDGQILSGTVFIQPNPVMVPDMSSVSYFLNGKKVGKGKKIPFTLGGDDGFNTAKLANGTYVLQGVCVTPRGEVNFTVSFQVLNNR